MARTIHQRRSALQERRTAESLGGAVQKGSGNSDFAKGDVRKPLDVRAECKTTQAASYSLKLHEWEKITGEAFRAGETPVMQVEFQRPVGLNVRLAVISWDYLLELRRQAKVLEDAVRNAR
jgi:hypothetical protein